MVSYLRITTFGGSIRHYQTIPLECFDYVRSDQKQTIQIVDREEFLLKITDEE